MHLYRFSPVPYLSRRAKNSVQSSSGERMIAFYIHATPLMLFSLMVIFFFFSLWHMKSILLIALINPAGLQRCCDLLVFKDQIIIISIVKICITKPYQPAVVTDQSTVTVCCFLNTDKD